MPESKSVTTTSCCWKNQSLTGVQDVQATSIEPPLLLQLRIGSPVFVALMVLMKTLSLAGRSARAVVEVMLSSQAPGVEESSHAA